MHYIQYAYDYMSIQSAINTTVHTLAKLIENVGVSFADGFTISQHSLERAVSRARVPAHYVIGNVLAYPPHHHSHLLHVSPGWL